MKWDLVERLRVDTSEIRYRVADFLKQHPPFNAMADADLVGLAAHGRVRFLPIDEFLVDSFATAVGECEMALGA